ncbi:hypothetical protein GQX73_g9551 [Xylaria multiplex]|uniref:C2H2-type domain-containing protein n=1 Tax=Xylaria multiplex TaxID=323545 RepID=A0A7C8IUB8_9PEZI|nr:hypothetical protein GQX73_g9551 [Xylaria multiplex]
MSARVRPPSRESPVLDADKPFTDTQERPFACDCGNRFTRQDLLSRHIRTCRPQAPQAEATFGVLPCDSDELYMNDFDIFWDRAFIPQPDVLFSLDAPIFGAQPQPAPQAATKVTSFSQFSSGLPSLDLVEDASDSHEADHSEDTRNQYQSARNNGYTDSAPWSISSSVFERLCEEIRSYASVLPIECQIPTNNDLTRGLETYLKCTQKYIPFIHVATFSAEERDVELPLVMAALGLLYRFEHNKAYKLYFMVRAIWAEKTRRENLRLASDVICNLDHTGQSKIDKLRKIQTLILLVIFASWGNNIVRPDALSMAGELTSK